MGQNHVLLPQKPMLPKHPPSHRSARFYKQRQSLLPFHSLVSICPLMKQGKGQVLKGPTLRRTEMANLQEVARLLVL